MHRRTRSGLVLAGVLAVAAPATAAAQLAVEHDLTVVTEITGNGNGVAEPGEHLAVTERVLSAEFEPLSSVTGTLTTSSADATVTTSSAEWPDLTFGAPVGNLTPFEIRLAASAPCGARVPMTLALSTSAGDAGLSLSVPTGSAGAALAVGSDDVPRVVPDVGTAESTATVLAAGRVKGVVVRLDRLSHPYPGDLRLEIVAPDGRSVVLSLRRGGAGSGFSGTVFDDAAEVSIRTASPPFTGRFQPEQPLAGLDGAPLDGEWRLRATDASPGSAGGIEAWGLDLAPAVCEGAAPPPPSEPPSCLTARQQRVLAHLRRIAPRGARAVQRAWERRCTRRHRAP